MPNETEFRLTNAVNELKEAKRSGLDWEECAALDEAIEIIETVKKISAGGL